MTKDISPELPVILVVDDTPDNLALVSGLLRDSYRVKVANSGANALRIANAEPGPDLILLDIMMPEMDGYEVCRRLKAAETTRDIPVIFLTARAEMEDERLGLEIGAVDYLLKPISPAIMLARVRNHLNLKRVADFLRDQNAFLDAEVQRRTESLRAIQNAAIVAMASLAATRDNETGNHIRRTQYYVRALALALRQQPRFGWITDDMVEALYRSAPLHDIGKIGVPDSVLLKPDRLTAEEFDIMKSHPAIGRDAIAAAAKDLPIGDRAFLQYAADIAYTHHEKWDGSGYPQGLKGDDIPLAGRLMALADVYDALISRRVYKAPYPHEKAVEMIVRGSGGHFDPLLVEVFLRINEDFKGIAARYAD